MSRCQHWVHGAEHSVCPMLFGNAFLINCVRHHRSLYLQLKRSTDKQTKQRESWLVLICWALSLVLGKRPQRAAGSGSTEGAAVSVNTALPLLWWQRHTSLLSFVAVAAFNYLLLPLTPSLSFFSFLLFFLNHIKGKCVNCVHQMVFFCSSVGTEELSTDEVNWLLGVFLVQGI